MLTLEERYEFCREHQFEAPRREPERVNVLVNGGELEIEEEGVLVGNNAVKQGVVVKVKDIEVFSDFKKWCEDNSIPTHYKRLDEHLRPIGLQFYDGMPYNINGFHQTIRLDVNIEASGQDIMEIALRYYSI